MISTILKDAQLDPAVALGAPLPALGSNAYLGEGDHFVAEVDESDRSLLQFRPVYAVLTNIDLEHMDEYADLTDLRKTFQQHLESIPFHGRIIACQDDSNVTALLRNVHRPVLTYGLDAAADFVARRTRYEGLHSEYELVHGTRCLGLVKLKVAGRHNVSNSLAAAATALSLEVPFEVVSQSLGGFSGVDRRLEWKGEVRGIGVIDDYAHHPVEIESSLLACKPLQRRLVLVFQPHRYTRTQQLLDRFARCFMPADMIYLLDIYPAGEEPIEGVSALRLAREVERYRPVTYVPSKANMLEILRSTTRPGDLVLTMGAGDVWKIAEDFLAQKE
jgi:UDP-N-acetylmuramate--alanine ligase